MFYLNGLQRKFLIQCLSVLVVNFFLSSQIAWAKPAPQQQGNKPSVQNMQPVAGVQNNSKQQQKTVDKLKDIEDSKGNNQYSGGNFVKKNDDSEEKPGSEVKVELKLSSNAEVNVNEKYLLEMKLYLEKKDIDADFVLTDKSYTKDELKKLFNIYFSVAGIPDEVDKNVLYAISRKDDGYEITGTFSWTPKKSQTGEHIIYIESGYYDKNNNAVILDVANTTVKVKDYKDIIIVSTEDEGSGGTAGGMDGGVPPPEGDVNEPDGSAGGGGAVSGETTDETHENPYASTPPVSGIAPGLDGPEGEDLSDITNDIYGNFNSVPVYTDLSLLTDINNDEIRKSIYELQNAFEKEREESLKIFLNSTKSYYEPLKAAVLANKSLWWNKNITPEEYYAGSDGSLNRKEAICMILYAVQEIEERVNLFSDGADNSDSLTLIAVRGRDILDLELSLRKTVLIPARKNYLTALHSAERNFTSKMDEVVKGLRNNAVIRFKDSFTAIFVMN